MIATSKLTASDQRETYAAFICDEMSRRFCCP